jgi:predicted nucleic acid-binding protein
MILLDTDVLIYATDRVSAQHEPSKRVVDAAIARRIDGVIVPQVLVEFVAATTGPSMRIPLSVDQARAQAAVFRSQLKLLLPPLDSIEEWSRVLEETGRADRRSFDAYLAGQARALGATAICTYNGDAFRGLTGIVSLTPEDINIPDALP